MRSIGSITRTVKVALVTGASLLAIVVVINSGPGGDLAKASVSGPSPSFTSAPLQFECPTCPRENNCTACHSGSQPNSGPGEVIISGLPLNYLPGQTVPVTVTVNDENAVIYGFQMVAVNKNGENAGTITLPPASPQQLQVISGFVNGNERRYVEHTIQGTTPVQFGTKSWTFNWTAPSERIGKLGFYAAGNGANSDGGTSGDNIYLSRAATMSGTAIANFDADTRSDISVYRPSNGTWYALTTSPPNFVVTQFGEPGDILAPGDYDGDGKTDHVVFRPSTGTWYLKKSTGSFNVVQFGQLGDLPVPGDYDGDGKFDIAVWRPSNGTWYFLGSTGIYRVRQFGANGDKPAQGDFDGDGITDFAVFRPSNGTWYRQLSKIPSYVVTQFGQAGDIPVHGDYDGDGKTDIAVFRPGNSTWYLLNPTQGFYVYPFGAAGDIPTPADYDGDGRTDLAVFRPSNGNWYILGTEGPTYTVRNFGIAGDIPVPSGYLPQ
ncbi:MAG TPA: FG-GAP-like repeat-containing protein [Pyrinomonadaceae bacterium]|nr:FG-GAP-like repeat-containing protein [Pyrinomonadaceae bacterium]